MPLVAGVLLTLLGLSVARSLYGVLSGIPVAGLFSADPAMRLAWQQVLAELVGMVVFALPVLVYLRQEQVAEVGRGTR